MDTPKDLLAAIKAATFEEDNRTRLRCADALRIAEEFDAAPQHVGQICNELKIKIVDCKLGCFK